LYIRVHREGSLRPTTKQLPINLDAILIERHQWLPVIIVNLSKSQPATRSSSRRKRDCKSRVIRTDLRRWAQPARKSPPRRRRSTCPLRGCTPPATGISRRYESSSSRRNLHPSTPAERRKTPPSWTSALSASWFVILLLHATTTIFVHFPSSTVLCRRT
jgi:hypothetical protein